MAVERSITASLDVSRRLGHRPGYHDSSLDDFPASTRASTVASTLVLPEPPGRVASNRAAIRLLAYVHLRNIHGSTGAGRVARQLVEHLAVDDKIDLRILADAGDKSRVLPLVPGPWQHFHYATFASDTSRQQARWFALGSPTAESYWPEANLVWCTGESYVPTRKARLAVTAHDAAYFEPDAHRHDRAFWQQRLKWKLLFNRISSRADLVHTVSQFSAERLAHFFPAMRDRIRVVHNAVTPHFFASTAAPRAQALARFDLASRPYVLIPGGLSYRKNADLILRVAPVLLHRFPDLLLVISGHSEPGYAAEAHRLCAQWQSAPHLPRRSSLSSRLRLLGFVDDTMLHGLYAGASAVWFPSRYEGFGMPVLEAMASGAPVVASNASSVPEISGDAALLADPANGDDHIEKLTGLITNPSLQDQLRLRGSEHARYFTWTRSAAHLKRCFEEVL